MARRTPMTDSLSAATRFRFSIRPGSAEVSITHLAVNASRHPDILESERMLDAARWERLDAQGLGHYLDADALMVYALKLLILERWQRVREADTNKALRELDL